MTDDTPEPVEDQTDYLQDCVDTDFRVLPGVYHFSSPLVLRHTNLVGCGPQRTRLVYTGPPDPMGAIQIRGGSWGYEMRGFDLAKQKPDDPAGVGIGAGLDETNGTQSGGSVWERVTVCGFETGAKLGYQQGSCSEMIFNSCQFSKCLTGIQCDGWNTLNLLFEMPAFLSCGVGLDTGRAGSVTVVGGAATEVTETILRFRAGGTFAVRGFRTEGCWRFIETGNTTATVSIAVDSCHTNAAEGRPDIVVSWGAALSVRDTILANHVVYMPTDETGHPTGYGSVTLDNVRTRAPVLLDSVVGARLRHSVRSCALIGPTSGEVVKRLDCDREIFAGPIC